MTGRRWLAAMVAVTGLAGAAVGGPPEFGRAEFSFNGRPAPAASAAVCGFAVVAEGNGPQVAILGRDGLAVCVRGGEEASVRIPIGPRQDGGRVVVELSVAGPTAVHAAWAVGQQRVAKTVGQKSPDRLETALGPGDGAITLSLKGDAADGRTETIVRLRNLLLHLGNERYPVPVVAAAADYGDGPPPELPPLRPAIEQALVEWDWRMQDGIGTERVPSSYAAAIERLLARGDPLLAELQQVAALPDATADAWQGLRREYGRLAVGSAAESDWESLWLRAHELRRAIALGNPLVPRGPLVFVKQVPSIFSHQLTQYYGSCARPGGGLFVLEAPGRSMRCRRLTTGLPEGSFQFAEVAGDGRRVLFAFCHAPTTPKHREQCLDRFYHLYEIGADGGGLRQLTGGPFDDFAARWLPDGRIVFVSTRRGGFHRCGRGPCPTYTLAVAEADGSRPRPISFHETHEWDPFVLNDGRVAYTRWDYVDRHAVHYQQLWTARPDGTDPRILYGNNTFNPVGLWEARAVPGSPRVMATAAAHHAMTAGSIVLIDTARGVDGPAPIERLTPDALFPESETPVAGKPPGAWRAGLGAGQVPPTPPEAARWPGHCYRTPWPLSESLFIAAYSFDALIGEPIGNPANMFGLYLVDRHGNKELLYRDVNIASLWPVPLAPRLPPPQLPSLLADAAPGEKPPAAKTPVAEAEQKPVGYFVLQDVYAGWPALERGTVRRLRIVQVLPKSTLHINLPAVGAANASPGRQVLGTAPVEPDGSAWFAAPAGVPLAFQALDEHGQALQIMRSITYLQPGETAGCVGCHEHRQVAPSVQGPPLALRRGPSAIAPGPDGSRPLAYARLVQPLLERHCVACHGDQRADGGLKLTARPEGHYTVSYNTLVKYVPYSAWGRADNAEPLTPPGHFGAVNSRLMKLLRAGHYDVRLSADEIERLATWVDANALFYGTFAPADQARQLRGEAIAGPDLE